MIVEGLSPFVGMLLFKIDCWNSLLSFVLSLQVSRVSSPDLRKSAQSQSQSALQWSGFSFYVNFLAISHTICILIINECLV